MVSGLLTALLFTAPAEATRRSPIFVGDWVPDDIGSVQAFCRRYDRVDGDLVIGPDFRSQDLRGLQCVVSVSGEVRVEGAPQVRGLDGIERLVGQDGLAVAAIRLRNNPSLHDTSALAKLGPQGVRDIEIIGNPMLADLSGLPPILNGGSVHIADNATLASVTLPAAAVPRTHLASVVVQGNPELAALGGLAKVSRVDGLQITDLPQLDQLDLLPNLTAAGTLTLAAMPGMHTLPAWPDLAVVNAWSLVELDALTDLPALPDLTRIKSLRIRDNKALTGISGLVVNRRSPPTIFDVHITGNASLPLGQINRVLERAHTFPDEGEWEIGDNGIVQQP